MNTINVDKQEAEDGKILSIFAYIIFLIPLLAARDNKFAQFHANQGLVLFLTGVALGIVEIILGFIPFLGFFIMILGNLAILAFVIIGIINVVNLEAKPLPLIGEITLIKSY